VTPTTMPLQKATLSCVDQVESDAFGTYTPTFGRKCSATERTVVELTPGKRRS
jgi:hypothetical protein